MRSGADIIRTVLKLDQHECIKYYVITLFNHSPLYSIWNNHTIYYGFNDKTTPMYSTKDFKSMLGNLTCSKTLSYI